MQIIRIIHLAFPAENIAKQIQVGQNIQENIKIIERQMNYLQQKFQCQNKLDAYAKQGQKYIPLNKIQFKNIEIIQVLYKQQQIETDRKISQINGDIDRIYNDIHTYHLDVKQFQNRQDYLRKLVKNASKLQQQIFVWYVISDPLVRNNTFKQDQSNQNLSPIYQQQFNINDYQDILRQAYTTNKAIKFQAQKIYANKQKIKQYFHKKQSRKILKIVQLFANVHQIDNQIYLALQSQTNIGCQQLCLASNIFSKKFNSDLIIVIGYGVSLLQKLQTQLLILTIQTHCLEQDKNIKSFIKIFYKNLFQRQSIKKSYQQALYVYRQLIKQNKRQKQLCCCLHNHTKQCGWNQIISITGISTAHQIFYHHQTLNGKKKQQILKLQQKIIKLTKINNTCYHQQLLTCCNKQQHQSRPRIKLNNLDQILEIKKIISQDTNNSLLSSDLFNGIIKQSHQKRQRHILIYKLINKILNTQIILEINGQKNSGKFSFTQVACRYIIKRKPQSFICKTIVIHNTYLKKYGKYIQQLIQQNQLNNKKIIITIQKMKQEKQFMEIIWENSQKLNNFIFIFLNDVSSGLQDNCIQIQYLNNKQIVYQVLKMFKHKNFQNYWLYILQRYTEDTNSCSQLSFKKFSKFLKHQHQNLQKIRREKVKSMFFIKNQMNTFRDRSKNLLNKLKNQNPSYWYFLDFLICFKQGIILDDKQQSPYYFLFQKSQIGQMKFILKEIQEFNEYNTSLITIQILPTRSIRVIPEDSILRYSNKIQKTYLDSQFRYFKILVTMASILIKLNLQYKINVETMDQGIFMINLSNQNDQQLEKYIQKIDKNFLMKQISKLIKDHSSHLIKLIDCLIVNDPSTLIFLIKIASIRPLFLTKQSILKDNIKNKLEKLSNTDLFSRIAKIQIQSLIKINIPLNNRKLNQSQQIVYYLSNYQRQRAKYKQKKLDKKNNPNFRGQQFIKLQNCIKQIEQIIQILQKNSQKLENLLSTITVPKCKLLIIKLLFQQVQAAYPFQIKLYYQSKNTNCASKIQQKLKNVINDQNPQLKKYLKQIQSDIDFCLNILSRVINRRQDGITLPKFEFVSQQFQDIYKLLSQKNNQKILQISKNPIMLFMKSRCLTVKGQPYVLIRRNQLIKQFLCNITKQYQVSSGFFYLNKQNFKLVGSTNNIFYLVITTDCLIRSIDKQIKYKILFQSEQTTSQCQYQPQQFIKLIKKANIKLLIICGNNTNLLALQLEKLKIKQLTVININSKMLSLKNGIIYNNHNNSQQKFIQKIKLFQKNQTYHRFIDLFITSISYQIVTKNNTKLSEFQLTKIVENSIKLIIKIMRQKWNLIDQVMEDIQVKIFCKQCQIPLLRLGTYVDLSARIFPIQNNLLSNTSTKMRISQQYQIVGRHQQIKDIMKELKELKENKQPYIEIYGQKNSGKTCLLEELCWLFLTKKTFKQGIYLLRMEQLRNHFTILQYFFMPAYNLIHLGNWIQSNQKLASQLLIALDNLQIRDIDQNIDFFQKIKTKPIQIVYTTQDQNLMNYLQNKINKSIKRVIVQHLSIKQMYNIALSKLLSKTNNFNKIQSIIKKLLPSTQNNSSKFLQELNCQLNLFNQSNKMSKINFTQLLKILKQQPLKKKIKIKIVF